MDDLVWVAPRPPRHGQGANRWRERLTAAAERPGEWARFGPFEKTGGGTSTQAQQAGRTLGLDIEAVSRSEPDGTYIFVRVVGKA